MKKNKVYGGILFLVCFYFFTIGCGIDRGHPGRLLSVDKTKCMFCGDGEDSFKTIYSGRPGVGLFCLNDQRMIQIQPSVDEDMKGDHTSHVWTDLYSVQVDRMVDRGISLVQYISDVGDVLDLEGLRKILCPACIDDIKEAVKIYGKGKKHKARAVCLVDLSTMGLYGIQQSFQYYVFDDYYVQASCQDDKIRLTVFHTPRDLDKL